jgi:hypothetical protein
MLLVLSGCGGSSDDDVHYDAVKAASCMRVAQPAEVIPGRVDEAATPGAFYRFFHDDRIGTMHLLLVVAYGPNRATALRRERLAHADLKNRYLHLPRAWARSDGNVIYEALGPTTVGELVRHRPPGKTPADALHAATAAGTRMKAELDGCLDRAREG